MDKIKSAAIIILGVGEKCAADILKTMNQREVKAIIEAINEIKSVSEEDVLNALNDFFIDSTAGSSIDESMRMQVKDSILSMVGNVTIDSMIDETDTHNVRWIEVLKMQPVHAILDMLVEEHPQIITVCLLVVFNKISNQKGSAIITGLPKELQTDVFRRMSAMGPVSSYALEVIANYFNSEFGNSDTNHLIKVDGIEAVANIIAQVDAETEHDILNKLCEDSSIREKIEDKVFPFQRLIDLDRKSLQTLIAEIKNEDLVVALKGVDERVKEAFFKNMSGKSADILKEDMQIMGPIKLSRVLEAQKTIVKIAKQLSSEEKILLSAKNNPNIVF